VIYRSLRQGETSTTWPEIVDFSAHFYFDLHKLAMKPISTTLEYIVDDPRYRKERPFAVHLGPNDKYDPADPALNTIVWEDRPTIIYDMRLLENVSLGTNGFQSFSCDFTPFKISEITAKEVERYQIETENFLKEALKAEKVICYDYRVGL